MKKPNKSGQSKGTAAGLVATITGLIILYILFLPPQERADLLGEPYYSGSGSGNSGSMGSSSQSDSSSSIIEEKIFSTSPGNILYQSLDEYEYELPSVTIMKTTDANIIEKENNFQIRNGWFDKIRKNITFDIEDIENTENVLLSFNTPRNKGTLMIKLNGKEIYNYDIESQSPDAIYLKNSDLNDGFNVLEFSVTGVGARFWSTNEYRFTDVAITGDIADTSKQQTNNIFYVSSEASNNIERVTLRFMPYCNKQDVGVLSVELNGREVFTGVPDCGALNSQVISVGMINTGKNSVVFKTEKGVYTIGEIKVKIRLEEPIQPTFYFDIDEDYFNIDKEESARCGDPDGVCPNNCGEDTDRDCCFEEYPSGYWCDIKTNYLGDRCVGFVDAGDCNRCRSGYEEKDGDIAKACEEKCGDDKDDYCPSGCSSKYDKDCCFGLSGDQYWCDDLPVTGVDFVCVNELTMSSCQNCLNEYDEEDGSFKCSYTKNYEDAEIKKNVDIFLDFEFTETGEEKEAELWINGQKTGFRTLSSSYRKNIDSFVEPGTNSIRMNPKTDLDIREMNVVVE